MALPYYKKKLTTVRKKQAAEKLERGNWNESIRKFRAEGGILLF